MPNSNPPRRQRLTPDDALPPGYSRHKSGTLRYRYTDPVRGRVDIYGATVAAIAAKLEAPVPVAHDPSLTVADYLRSWAAGRPDQVRANTAAEDIGVVQRILIPRLGERLRLHQLSAEHVERMLGDLSRATSRSGRPYAPRSVAIAKATLRKALAPAVPSRIPTNPAAAARLPRGKRAPVVGVEIPVPSRGQIIALRDHLRTAAPDLYPMVMLTANTGMRQSEVLGLQRSSLELPDPAVPGATGRLTVRGVLLRDFLILEDPKTDGSGRPYVLAPRMVTILRERLQDQRIAQLTAGPRWSNHPGLVFTDALGGALDGRQLTKALQRQARAIGLPPFDWKSLRHAFASQSLEDGVDLAIVSKALGHSSVGITADIYAHYTGRMRAHVADLAAARMFGE